VTREFHRCLFRGKSSRAYYNIGKLPKKKISVRLCGSCERYLLEKSNDPCDYWAAMIYEFLTHGNSPGVVEVSFQERWKILPQTWRGWWEDEFEDAMIDECEPVFVDVTKELKEVENAISQLRWRNLAATMDKHFAYPEVRRRDSLLFFIVRFTLTIWVFLVRSDALGGVPSSYIEQTSYS